MRSLLCGLFCWFCFPLFLCGDDTSFQFGNPINIIASPNKAMKAQVIGVGHAENDQSYDVVKIFKNDTEITEYPLVRNNDGMSRSVYAIKWSPDSKFLVFLTKYVGGHSDWHSPTSIYDVANNTFWELDKHGSLVVGENFDFVGPDMLKIKVLEGKDVSVNKPVEKTFSLTDWIKAWSPPS